MTRSRRLPHRSAARARWPPLAPGGRRRRTLPAAAAGARRHPEPHHLSRRDHRRRRAGDGHRCARASRRPTAFAHAPTELIGKVAKRTLLPGRFVPLASRPRRLAGRAGRGGAGRVRRGRPDHLGHGASRLSRVRPATWSRSATSTAARSFPAPSWPTAPSGSAHHEACVRFILALAIALGLQPAMAMAPTSTAAALRQDGGGRRRAATAMAAASGNGPGYRPAPRDAGQGGPLSRIKDIAVLQSARDNQLVGYGLVIGLQGTGDSLRNSPYTEQSIRAMLENLGIATRGRPRARQERRRGDRHRQPAGLRRIRCPHRRQRLLARRCRVADGGTLVMTPLKAADGADLCGRAGLGLRLRLLRPGPGRDADARRADVGPHSERRHRRTRRSPAVSRTTAP